MLIPQLDAQWSRHPAEGAEGRNGEEEVEAETVSNLREISL